MNRKAILVHIGMTVTNMQRTIDFYEKHFGFSVEEKGVFPAEFIASVPQLYHQKAGVYSDYAFLVSPNGIALELFQFSDLLPAEEPVWNRPGYHHLCLKVESVPETYEALRAAGVEFYFEPGLRGDPKDNVYWIFLQDPDGNMIELQD